MPFNDTALTVDFNFESMEGLIGNRATDVVHEISVNCPCRASTSQEGSIGHVDATCPLCYGKGKLFRDPIQACGLITNMTNNRMWAQVGWVKPGDLSFVPSTHSRRINDFDRIIMMMPIPTDGQVITRGVADPFSPRPAGLGDDEDLLYWEAGRAEAVWVEDSTGKVWTVPSYSLRGRRVVWAPGGGPRVGTKYSIKYEAYPEYIAWTTPFDRWDRQRELGQRVMLRRSVLEADPTGREIRPPWEELLNSNSGSRTDVYGKYGVLGLDPVSPPR